MKEKYKYLSKNVLLFAINGFVPRVLSFILIPLYTHYLTPEEYGISDLINTTVLLLIPIFTLDIQDAVMRYAFDKAYKQSEVFSVGIQVLIKGACVVALGCFALYFFQLLEIKRIYLVFTFIMYIANATSNIISLFCRGIEKVSTIMVGSILNSVCALTCNILFLAVWHWGIIGFLLANSLGMIVNVIYCVIKAQLYRYLTWHIPNHVFREMSAFSIPLIFSVIAWWVNTASSRYILTWELGIAASGLFAIAYKIPTILAIFQNIFAQAWSISAIKEFDPLDTDGFIGNVYTMMNLGMCVIGSLLMIFNIPIAWILYSDTFFDAWYFVPPLLVAVVFNAMGLFIGSIFTAVKDTKTLSYSTIIGAIITIIGNIIFVKIGGIYGAAIATMIGYGVTLLMRLIILRKYIHMKTDWKKQGWVYGCLGIQLIISTQGIYFIPVQVLVLGLMCYAYKQNIKQMFLLLKSKF